MLTFNPMRKAYIIGAALLMAACGPRPSAQVEKVEICTEVGDYGLLVDAIEITVSNPRSIKGLKAADFDLVNNVSGAFLDAETGRPGAKGTCCGSRQRRSTRPAGWKVSSSASPGSCNVLWIRPSA